MYKVLIFDLGGVLLDIDVGRAVEAFRSLSQDPDQLPPVAELLNHQIFRQFEVGVLDPPGFRKAMRDTFLLAATDAEIDAAWNALLLSPFPGRAELLRKLAKRYRLILLSNTNRIHYEAFIGPCQEMFESFSDFIYSFEVGLRKPGAEIYQHAVSLTGLSPKDCLFIDDSIQNLEAAADLGISTFHFDQEVDFQVLTTTLFN